MGFFGLFSVYQIVQNKDNRTLITNHYLLLFRISYWCNSHKTFTGLICAQDHQGAKEMFGEIESLGRKTLPSLFSVPLQWKFYVNQMRKACPRHGPTAFKENYHLSALFRQRLGNSLESQAPIVLHIV